MLVKKIFGQQTRPATVLLLGPRARQRPAGRRDPATPSRRRRPAPEGGHHGYGVLGEAEVEVPLVAERARGAARCPFGSAQVQADHALRPLVEPNTPLAQAVEDGPAADSSSEDRWPSPSQPTTAMRSPCPPAASSPATVRAFTQAPIKTEGAPRVASMTRVPFAVLMTTVEPGAIPALLSPSASCRSRSP